MRSALRHDFFSSVLHREYIWMPMPEQDKEDAAGTSYGGDVDLSDIESSEDGVKRVKLHSKEYIPPTEFDPDAPKPFGNVLDEPLG